VNRKDSELEAAVSRVGELAQAAGVDVRKLKGVDGQYLWPGIDFAAPKETRRDFYLSGEFDTALGRVGFCVPKRIALDEEGKYTLEIIEMSVVTGVPGELARMKLEGYIRKRAEGAGDGEQKDKC